ncbi:glycosyltransferase family 1 protein [Cellulomonas sp. URHD0024]|uniref:glycosyltransferase family 4 protein n=1 Tax=Cellulomonas sp. URHD0024 TaxID=1302620 RepID=UPI000401209B|nr:glycosyltransferase family 1 protein [Cellulomonas sp. URHD0024]
MTLRVLLDATAIPRARGGVGRYVDDLVPALVATGLELVVAAQRADVEQFEGSGARVVAAPGAVRARGARLVWEQTMLPALARRVRADVLHSPHYTRPLVRTVPTVVTLHDATFFSHPHLHDGLKVRLFKAATRGAVRHADALVVPSVATRDEVLRFVPGDRSRFHVAYHGVDARVFRPTGPDERARVAAKLGVTGPWVAFLGTLEPRKNVPALVRAWVDASAGRPDPPALVLAGARGWDQDVDAAVAAVPSGLRVVAPGYLPVEDLAPLLGGAAVVAYPSLGEGFGLPVLEAIACGACVLTTRELSLPEVGGDAVEYCGTERPDIAAGLTRLLDDPERRAELGAAALARSSRFTWAASAQAHVRAYEAAVGR